MKLYRVNIGYGDIVTFDLVLHATTHNTHNTLTTHTQHTQHTHNTLTTHNTHLYAIRSPINNWGWNFFRVIRIMFWIVLQNCIFSKFVINRISSFKQLDICGLENYPIWTSVGQLSRQQKRSFVRYLSVSHGLNSAELWKEESRSCSVRNL
jgi:hypothetical protein